MKKTLLVFLFATVLSSTLWSATPSAKEKFFVVERESESVVIIHKGVTEGRMENMHNMNHGIIKFDGEDGYLISRDGYVVRFDPVKEKVLRAHYAPLSFTRDAYWSLVCNGPLGCQSAI